MPQPDPDGPTVDDLLEQIRELQEQSRVDQRLIAAFQAQSGADSTQIATLQIALQTARRIGAAVGILMSTRRHTEEAAFQLLRDVSSRTRRVLGGSGGELSMISWRIPSGAYA